LWSVDFIKAYDQNSNQQDSFDQKVSPSKKKQRLESDQKIVARNTFSNRKSSASNTKSKE
jgi:hypothetical protein